MLDEATLTKFVTQNVKVILKIKKSNEAAAKANKKKGWFKGLFSKGEVNEKEKKQIQADLKKMKAKNNITDMIDEKDEIDFEKRTEEQEKLMNQLNTSDTIPIDW